MEQQSFTNIVSQSVDYLGQSHNWTDTDIISSYKEICKQLDICKEKLREEHELQKEESALRAEEKRLIRMKNTLWRRLGSSICVEKGNKLVSSKSLKCSSLYRRNDIYSEQQTHSKKSYVPLYNRFLRDRRIRRKIRYENINSHVTLNYFRQLPQQTTNHLFTNHIFNGVTNF
ncbi:uncharacterized protein OCT59_026531 [Rhizophagus irregularis]|uniref:Uncharacterized protein n=1 Tax=Rhizophagus irregularis (strain DAOM 181602 / DAOM 197198 / MUCL 43194) TaxID=747089 RepID=U9T3Y5_RHIID|nr:hypothetical protein OCT59_026531 [Rhizophagus irregularis]GBC16746.2 hypothetical protein GLOIN_2v1835733 [Rhizophagus irregularis DAOM 181602=DAOM 197198]